MVPGKLGEGGATRRLILSTIVLDDGDGREILSSDIFSDIPPSESTIFIPGAFASPSCYRNETKIL